MPARDWWAVLWPDPKAVVRKLGIRAGMRVVDLCCGDGYFTAAIARVTGGQVYGIDADPEMLDTTREELARSGVSALDLICGDARHLPALLPQTVDYVLLANTFHGVPDKLAFARIVRKVLGPDGRFCIVNWHALPRERTVVLSEPRGPKTALRMSPEAVRQAVEPAGFVLERIVELKPYHYGAIFRAVPDGAGGG